MSSGKVKDLVMSLENILKYSYIHYIPFIHYVHYIHYIHYIHLPAHAIIYALMYIYICLLSYILLNTLSLVKGTLSNVKESVTSTSHTTSSNPLNPASSINPMGDTPSREPIDNPEQKGMSKETEELQRKGADRKAEEDSFNLM